MEGLHLQRLGLQQPHEGKLVLQHERPQLVGPAEAPRGCRQVRLLDHALAVRVRLEEDRLEQGVRRTSDTSAPERVSIAFAAVS